MSINVTTARRLARRKVEKKKGSIASPLLAIISALVLVKIFSSVNTPEFLTDTYSKTISNQGFITNVLKFAGFTQYSAPVNLEWMDVVAMQSSVFNEAFSDWKASSLAPEGGDHSDDDEPILPPPSATPSTTPSPSPSPIWAIDPISSATPTESPAPTATPSDISEWIGGVYTPPKANDPQAQKLFEVTLLASDPSYYDMNGLVAIKNKVTKPIDVKAIMANKLTFAKTDGQKPQILIIHTHGSESYMPDARDFYVPTDIQRTEDTRFNIIRIGKEIAKGFTALGLNVIHDKTICDYPSYTGSYSKSFTIIEKHVKENPSIQVVIDIHRDAIGTDGGTIYKTVSSTDKGKAAQMMLVMGSNISGLKHDTWKNNLNMACRIQQAILEKYSTLMRPISLRKERFNQQATAGSMLLEVGTAGNSLQEAILAGQLFAETAGPAIKEMIMK